jgi:hypothetical protein
MKPELIFLGCFRDLGRTQPDVTRVFSIESQGGDCLLDFAAWRLRGLNYRNRRLGSSPGLSTFASASCLPSATPPRQSLTRQRDKTRYRSLFAVASTESRPASPREVLSTPLLRGFTHPRCLPVRYSPHCFSRQFLPKEPHLHSTVSAGRGSSRQQTPITAKGQ